MKKLKISYENNRIEMIDLLKSFSIFTIVIMHLIQIYMKNIPSILSTLSSIGGTGAHVFFLISGMGLYLSYLRKKTTFYEFLKKRFSKMYIPYIIIVIISFFIPSLYTGDDRIIALLSHIFLFKMFVSKYDGSFGGHFWFISTIIQFYLISIPLFRIKEKIGKKKMLIFSFIISIVWWLLCFFLNISDRIFTSCFLQYMWEFTLGMIFADYISENKTIELNKCMLIVVAIPCLLIQFLMTRVPGLHLFNDIPGMFGYIFLAMFLLNINIIKKVIGQLFKNSYEIYLTHIMVATIVFKLISPNTLFLEIIAAIITVIFCIIFSDLYKKILKSLFA